MAEKAFAFKPAENIPLKTLSIIFRFMADRRDSEIRQRFSS
ncbi:MAG TPA: hypothetical protein VFF09_00830 [archaeon]|nr:hypothetical protein [archaeon]